jgi:hypothetical protein
MDKVEEHLMCRAARKGGDASLLEEAGDISGPCRRNLAHHPQMATIFRGLAPIASSYVLNEACL